MLRRQHLPESFHLRRLGWLDRVPKAGGPTHAIRQHVRGVEA
jgi:hypothetical protein